MKVWKRTFELGEDRKGTPAEAITSGGNWHHRTTCGNDRIIPGVGTNRIVDHASKFGTRCHEARVHVTKKSEVCQNLPYYTVRLFPTWDGKFKLPFLIQFWLKVEASSWQVVAGRRFSPLTVKGREPKEGQILTTHVLPDGTVDIGHAEMLEQDKAVRVPLNIWSLHSLYVESLAEETWAELWIDGQKTVEARCDTDWDEEELRHWHAGLYVDLDDVKEEFAVLNDEIQIREVEGVEVNELIKAELERGNGNSEPNPPSEEKETYTLAWDPVPGAKGYRVYWGDISETYSESFDVGDNVMQMLELEQGHGNRYVAVTAYDSDGRESGFSEELVIGLQPPKNLRLI